MEYDNTNSGAIFRNENKEGKQPDYRGNINVEGKDFEIALWVKESQKTGKKFFSAKISEPYKKDGKPSKAAPADDSDDVPF